MRINIVLSGEGPHMEFVEIEDQWGKSVKVGEQFRQDNGYWAIGLDVVVTRRDELLARLEDWVEGRRSYCNYGPHAPYTPDVIAVMDAQEVVKLAAAISAFSAISGEVGE
jgi:hypothetical protein